TAVATPPPAGAGCAAAAAGAENAARPTSAKPRSACFIMSFPLSFEPHVHVACSIPRCRTRRWRRAGRRQCEQSFGQDIADPDRAQPQSPAGEAGPDVCPEHAGGGPLLRTADRSRKQATNLVLMSGRVTATRPAKVANLV